MTIQTIQSEDVFVFRTFVYFSLFILSAAAMVCQRLAKRAESHMDLGTEATSFHRLQRRYFFVFLPATFSDWLQGPYVYRLYSHYGYSESEIAILYIVGFVSSVSFGTFVGSLADRFGRKRLCVVYCILYSFCCLTKASSNFEILIMGRFFGGVSTSILFSTFEAWYIHEHTRKNFPQQWINITMSKSTFYNAIIAIIAGLVANFVAETLNFGPVSPFLLAIPCLAISGVLIHSYWQENDLALSDGSTVTYLQALRILLSPSSHKMVKLCAIQSIFESVMYTFVFLWTPVLVPVSPPLGIVFSCFMVCIMVGSSLYYFLLSKNFTSEKLLLFAVIVAFISLSVCTYATSHDSVFNSQLCYAAFLLYEMSVGVYFPATGYLRSLVVPEAYRSGITNWFRVPMNLMVCTSLFLLRSDKTAPSKASSGHTPFLLCSCFLVVAIFITVRFQPEQDKTERHLKQNFLEI